MTSPAPSAPDAHTGTTTGTAARSRRGRRAAWAVPGVVAVAAVAAAVVPGSASAGKSPSLPPLSAAQLLAAVGSSTTQALSGTVVQTSKLGLPSLPGADRGAALDWQALLSGSHTARVWLDGADHQRIALVGQLAESDVVRSGNDVWTYTSADQKVSHVVLPAEGADKDKDKDKDKAGKAPAQQLTPAAAADRALKAVGPTTTVSVDPTTTVAGRSAYSLVLAPKDTRSTVRRVAIAVDSATHVPLRVQVYGAGPDAAFSTGFTDVSFARPAADVFRFAPPQGAKTTTYQLPAQHAPGHGQGQAKTGPDPKVVGTGWTSVVVLPAGSAAQLSGSSASLVGRLSTPAPDGARLVRTALVNVLLAKDGRVLVGAVSPQVLEQVAQG